MIWKATRFFSFKVTLQQIGRRLMVWIGLDGALATLHLLDHEALLAHQAPNPVLATGSPFRLQGTPVPLVTICLPALFKNAPDFFCELGIGSLLPTGGTRPPVGVTTTRNIHCFTHRLHL
jgi:hypothetical protein